MIIEKQDCTNITGRVSERANNAIGLIREGRVQGLAWNAEGVLTTTETGAVADIVDIAAALSEAGVHFGGKELASPAVLERIRSRFKEWTNDNTPPAWALAGQRG